MQITNLKKFAEGIYYISLSLGEGDPCRIDIGEKGLIVLIANEKVSVLSVECSCYPNPDEKTYVCPEAKNNPFARGLKKSLDILQKNAGSI